MNTYFICWFIIQNYFICFDVQMFKVWPLGTPLIYFDCVCVCMCLCLNAYFMAVQDTMSSSFTVASVLKSALVTFHGKWY